MDDSLPTIQQTKQVIPLKTVTSVSGGRTSAYLAANYPSDYNVFALVRTDDQECLFPDDGVRRIVEDKTQAPFIGTLEDDEIIYTIIDLEQFIGRRIDWVTGITYDEVIRTKGGWLPNKLHRYCTSWMKIEPIFQWWKKQINEPVEMRIGYRYSDREIKRANRMLAKVNSDGLLTHKASFEKNQRGQNKWVTVPWQKPAFPLIDDAITSVDIHNYWQGKPVRFAEYNNCVGCFHRSPPFLRMMWDHHPNKMNWFKKQEDGRLRGLFRTDMRYENIEKMLPNIQLFPSDFGPCDSGYCGI